MRFHYKTPALLVIVVSMLSSCGNSVTNVWDYYIKNNVEVHRMNEMTITKAELLYRSGESVNKAQLEFVAFKQDSTKYLVIGSHKIAKNFYLRDSLYTFDVTDLYSRVRGDDFIRQMGDLNIYFTHISMAAVDTLLSKEADLRATYRTTNPVKSETVYVDYQLAPDVFISLPKENNAKKPGDILLWVGKRKHDISASDFIKVLNEFKAFQ